MIVVLASRRDREARQLAEAWSAHDARVMTPDDLSTAGWRVASSSLETSRVVVAGQLYDAADIAGVVTRLTYVNPAELTRIDEADRAYAAQEMTAFLGYWLSTLTCPLLNPPGPISLCGPGWRAERWLVAAAGMGLTVAPRVRRVRRFGATDEPNGPPEVPQATLVLTVVGDRCVRTGAAAGEIRDEVVEQRAADGARRLASAAGAPMASFGFRSRGASLALTGAGPALGILNPDVRTAMLEYLGAAAPREERERGLA